ncbi:MAG: WYL domain-containing protein [Muribaculaceae bacterium]|nr:WYL domain-containing protein [Muribaculaceae bacterium]
MSTESGVIIRQLLIVQKLNQAGIPVPADDLLSYLESKKLIHDYSYPEKRRSQMRLLQRDINSIYDTFRIEIVRAGKSSYSIAGCDKDWLVSYERLFTDFDLLTAIHPDSDINRYIKPERSRNKGSHYLMEILKAIKDKCKIEFDYVNYRCGGRERHHILSPHFLKEDQGLWYVAGYENDRLLILGLDRIKNLTITDEDFRFDESLDLERLFEDSFGIWADPAMPVEEITLHYDALDGSFIKAKPLHPSQKILTDDDEGVTVKLNLKITNDFVMALLSRARSLEVISPLHLRERIRQTLSDALRRNS